MIIPNPARAKEYYKKLYYEKIVKIYKDIRGLEERIKYLENHINDIKYRNIWLKILEDIKTCGRSSVTEHYKSYGITLPGDEYIVTSDRIPYIERNIKDCEKLREVKGYVRLQKSLEIIKMYYNNLGLTYEEILEKSVSLSEMYGTDKFYLSMGAYEFNLDGIDDIQVDTCSSDADYYRYGNLEEDESSSEYIMIPSYQRFQFDTKNHIIMGDYSSDSSFRFFRRDFQKILKEQGRGKSLELCREMNMESLQNRISKMRNNI